MPTRGGAGVGYGGRIDLVEAARTEAVDLHTFFVGWLTGTLDDTDRVFERFADVLHPAFSMIVPSGEVLDRDAVVESVRVAHGSAEASFAIEIRNVVARFANGDAVVVTYEEWQFLGDRVDDRRMSTAVFLRSTAAVNGVRWRHLHETVRSA
jgi:hypothetical protein